MMPRVVVVVVVVVVPPETDGSFDLFVSCERGTANRSIRGGRNRTHRLQCHGNVGS